MRRRETKTERDRKMETRTERQTGEEGERQRWQQATLGLGQSEAWGLRRWSGARPRFSFKEGGEGRERGRNITLWLPLTRPRLGAQPCPQRRHAP